jgi:K+/H+ antiporter YhaU regulatory subunit KhtT
MSSFEHFSKISKKKNHLHKNMSSINSSLNHENIYDSKINEERPIVNKSLGKHQINNNLQMWTKAGAKIYKEGQWISKKN